MIAVQNLCIAGAFGVAQGCFRYVSRKTPQWLVDAKVLPNRSFDLKAVQYGFAFLRMYFSAVTFLLLKNRYLLTPYAILIGFPLGYVLTMELILYYVKNNPF